jgi:hypothetical protein
MKPVMTVLSFFLVLTLHSIGAAQTVQKGSDLGRRQKSDCRRGCRRQK